MIVDSRHGGGEVTEGLPSVAPAVRAARSGPTAHQVAENVNVAALVYAPLILSAEQSGRALVKCPEMALSSHAELQPPTMEEWRAWLDILVRDSTQLPGFKTLKYSDSVEVFRARIPIPTTSGEAHLEVLCKRTEASGMVGRATGVFRSSRARRNFDRALTCLKAGIRTAIPLALIEKQTSPRTAWLVSVFLRDVVDLDCFAMRLLPRLNASRARSAKTAIALAVAEFLARFHRAGLHHRDLKASNILLADRDLFDPRTSARATSGEPTDAIPLADPPRTARAFVVDLDGLAGKSRWRPNQRWQPLVRLAASLIDYAEITRTDYARCLREYMAMCDHDPAQWRMHYRRLARRAMAYARRSQHRKSGKLDGFSGAGGVTLV